MRSQTTRTIAGRVNGDGTIANPGGGGFTAQRTGVGTYIVTVAGRLLAATTSTQGNGYTIVGPPGPAITERSFGVITNTMSQAGQDSGFTFNATVAA